MDNPTPAPPTAPSLRDLMIEGLEFAKKLQIILPGIQALQAPPHQYTDCKHEPSEPISEGLHLADSLARDVVQSFTKAISMLDAGDRVGLCSIGECCKTDQKKLPPGRVRRGCYKRRRTTDTWIEETTTPFDDGHAWRKYGQKEILGSNFPRSYFRCTHKHDEGCEASKQVQRKEDGSGMFVVTYMRHHTCREPLMASPFIIDSVAKERIVLNFQTTSIEERQQQQYPLDRCFSSFTSVQKQELSTGLNHNHCSSSAHQNKFGHPRLTTDSDAGEVVSAMCSSVTSQHMEEDNNTVDDSVNFEDILNFDDADSDSLLSLFCDQ
ncbi:probable WRKY transcription factor 54 [Aristolochia californica]|uniref:probable WRKY transcription factor 54 n=1 Tax=Aristolochia californica TaxID=171875 RepID=UPI0035E2AB53